MIRLIELNPLNVPMDKETWWNLLYHLHIMNEIRYYWGQPMICTSGIRSKEQHLEIYKGINKDREADGLPPIIPPAKSPHLIGCASDWADSDGHLFFFLADHPDLMEELDIYVEYRSHTPNHCHIQTIPPKSGKRFFHPY